MPSLSAYLTIDGAAAAIDFYKAAFGAEEVARMPSDDQPGKLLHAELTIFGGRVYLSDDMDMPGFKNPLALGAVPFNMIAVFDTPAEVDAATAKAEAAGATVTMKPEDTFWGDRFAMVRDPFGHVWAFDAELPKI